MFNCLFVKSKNVGFTYRNQRRDARHTQHTHLIQVAPVQDCLPGTYVLNKNQVNKFCE